VIFRGREPTADRTFNFSDTLHKKYAWTSR